MKKNNFPLYPFKDKQEKFKPRKRISLFTLSLGILFFALMGITLFYSLQKHFDEDEFEAIHTAWKILKGERIYIDFFQHHHPLFYYLLIPFIALIGEKTTTIIAIRGLTFLILFLISGITYVLARKVFNSKIALVSLILLAGSLAFVENTIEIRPDVVQTFFGILALFFLFIYFDLQANQTGDRRKSGKYLILSALSLAISFLFLQKAIFLIFLLGFLLLFSALKKEIPWRDIFIYALVFLFTLLPYFAYLYFNDLLSLYWFLNWTLNQNFLNQFSPFSTLISLYKTNILLLFFYLLGIFWVLFKGKLQQKKIGFLALGLFLSFFIVRSPYPQYLTPAFPLMAIIAAFTLYSIFREGNEKLIIFILILSTIISVHYFFQNPQNADWKNKEQLEKINYVLSLTSPQDFVYDGDISFNLFRRDIDYFWFSIKPNRGLATYQTLKPYPYDIYALIEKYKPSVISVEYIENREDERIIKKYVQSKIYNDLFIRKDAY